MNDRPARNPTTGLADVLAELRDENWRGPAQHLRDWRDLDDLHERAARTIETLRHHISLLENDLQWWRDGFEKKVVNHGR
jgi:hypothetical protein